MTDPRDTADGVAGADSGPAPSSPSGRAPLTAATLAAIVAPGLVIFVFPMVSLIARNDEYFGGAYGSGRVLYLAGALTMLVGALTWAVSGTRVGRPLFTGYVLLTPAWIAYSLFGDSSDTVGVVVVGSIVIALVVYLTLRPRPQFLPFLGLLAGLVVVATGAGTAIDVTQAGEASPSSSGVADRASEGDSDLPNIYHVVLDEYQTEMFEAVLDDELRASLGGFTWYPNAQTTWGRTEMSMATVLGQDEWDFESTARDYVEEALLGPTSSLQQLKDLGYETSGYYHNPSSYGEPSPFDHRYLATDLSNSRPAADYGTLATSLWLYANLPGRIAEPLIPAAQWAQLTGGTLVPDDAPSLSVDNFETFLAREARLPATGRYELVHLLLPHFPYVLTPDCEFESGTRTSPEEQTECAMALMDELIERLERLDRFEDSVVVIQGDHGASFALDGEGVLRSLGQDLFSEEWSRARSRPLLLVKPAGVSGDGALVESDYPALLTDIMPTVFDSIGAELDVAEGRVSLLADELPPRDERLYHFFTLGPDGLPDEEVQRYVISGEVVTTDGLIPVP